MGLIFNISANDESQCCYSFFFYFPFSSSFFFTVTSSSLNWILFFILFHQLFLLVFFIFLFIIFFFFEIFVHWFDLCIRIWIVTKIEATWANSVIFGFRKRINFWNFIVCCKKYYDTWLDFITSMKRGKKRETIARCVIAFFRLYLSLESVFFLFFFWLSFFFKPSCESRNSTIRLEWKTRSRFS